MTPPMTTGSAHRPLTWWSDDALAALAGRVDVPWRAWCEQWGIPPGTPGARNAQDLASAGDEMHWLAPHAMAGGWAWLGSAASPPPAAIERALFAAVAPRAAGDAGEALAAEVAREACVALYRLIANALSTEATCLSSDGPAAPAAPPPNDARPWSGAVCIVMPASDRSVCLCLHLSPDCARALCASDRVLTCREPVADLAPIDAALSAVPLTLRVELGAVQLDLGSLRALQIGDVVPLPHSLEAPMQVSVLHNGPPALPGSAARVCHAHLGARRGHRAIELVSTLPSHS